MAEPAQGPLAVGVVGVELGGLERAVGVGLSSRIARTMRPECDLVRS